MGVTGAFKTSRTALGGFSYFSAPRSHAAEQKSSKEAFVAGFIWLGQSYGKPGTEVNEGRAAAELPGSLDFRVGPVSQSPRLAQLELSLNGEISELARLIRELESYCEANGLAGDAQFQLTLALDELFTNSVRHGGCKGIAGAVEVCLEPVDQALRVEFRDRGTPFNPLDVPPPNLKATLEERAQGGLGVHFVRQMMRNLQYDRCGEWNRLSMELPL